MDLEIGSIVEGKVTGIMKFGAFVQLPNGKSGLVHISEIANTYVSEVSDYLTSGQTVKVKILGVNDAGKINLSIKQTLPPEPRPVRNGYAPRTGSPSPAGSNRGGSRRSEGPGSGAVSGPSGDASFEDKLKAFMQESDSRMSGNKMYADRKTAGRRRGK